MHCPHCGEELAEGTAFCPYCMSPLKEKTKIPPLYGKRRAAGVWALCLFSLLAAAVFFFLTHKQTPGQAPLPGPAGSASLNAAETTSKATENTPSQSAGTAAPATEPPTETLPAPNLYIYFAKVTLPRYPGELPQIRVDDVEWETVYNGDGTYKVKVFLTVINRRSSSIISGVPCYLGGVESDLIYPKELIPGETVRVESVFSSVPGGSYTLTF